MATRPGYEGALRRGVVAKESGTGFRPVVSSRGNDRLEIQVPVLCRGSCPRRANPCTCCIACRPHRDRFKRTATFSASSVVENGTDSFCRNGLQGAAHKRGLSFLPFLEGVALLGIGRGHQSARPSPIPSSVRRTYTICHALALRDVVVAFLRHGCFSTTSSSATQLLLFKVYVNREKHRLVLGS